MTTGSAAGALDAIVVGGGFYGTSIATYLRERRGFARVALVEAEAELLTHASYNNQARIHNGYHYPRSFTTAYRSRVNLPKFVAEYPEAVKRDFTKLYAIARRNSKVTARQFERFCSDIGASLSKAGSAYEKLFESRLIEAVYVVEEYAFDATRLREHAHRHLSANAVDVHLSTRVVDVSPTDRGLLEVVLASPTGPHRLHARWVFNCTYAGLNHLGRSAGTTRTRLKHEITEMALVRMPPELADVGITVMDGPFFSCMPFPARGLHTLSHVRYTPHAQWEDSGSVDPYERLSRHPRHSHADWMRRDASRYVPALARAEQVDSLYEVKTVLVKNESDDGRPILFERSDSLPGLYFVLGGKIDNIFDILERMDQEVALVA